jgi:hypothetical protein
MFMSKFKTGLLGLGLGLGLWISQPLWAAGNTGFGADPSESAAVGAGSRPKSSSHEAEPDDIQETQDLFSALALETRRLDKPQLEPLFKSLDKEYHLSDYVGKSRKALDQAESVLNVQDAMATQDSRAKDLSVITTKEDDEKAKALQGDLKASSADLKKTVTDIQNKAGEDEVRDLRNWLMISEGQLRRLREDQEAQGPSATAQALSSSAAISAAAMSPSAQAGSPAASNQSFTAQTAQP